MKRNNALSLTIRAAIGSTIILGVIAVLPSAAQAPSLSDMYARIKAEETNNSKIMWIIHEVADVHGPRVTGTPNLKGADDWAVKTMTSFGLSNAHLEPWTFQPPSAATPVGGWDNLLLQADAVSPFHGQLMVKPLAWTPGTKGPVTATVVQITPPGTGGGGGGFGAGRGGAQTPAAPAWAPPPMPPAATPATSVQPTHAELDAYLNSVKAKIRGHIVMVGKHVEVPENFYPAPLRRTEDDWKAQFDPNNPNVGRGGRGPAPQLGPDQMTGAQVLQVINEFLVDNGALVRINDAGREHGIIIAQQNNNYDSTRVVPTLVMRNEDYGRISRILADGTPVTLKINILNQEYPDGKTSYNAIGEIPGTDKKDEVVMLGGHFDSWHDATGATDNGIGSSMMLEAIRILAALHVQPRRTIRVALWSGEEEGLLGSLAYVKHHFGSFEEPKPEFAKLDAYFNIDSGTGKPRGAGVFGPAAAADMVRDAMMPYQDWGFMGARASNSRATGGTDSTSFNNAGLPGIGLNQDAFDYGSFTHHTNLDTYERIYEEDVREGAVEIASAVYAIAMADNMVPRFSAADMPKPVPEPGPGATAVPPTHKLGGGTPAGGKGGRGASTKGNGGTK
ncbi:MAG TPA: M20/M25/M40 family metallo-hydrolase [Candidatus Acidoferrales bacterium]|nr:M20/M25/M40 family metallo-hydrolase [Candidatus Acidoferrales bacterium]